MWVPGRDVAVLLWQWQEDQLGQGGSRGRYHQHRRFGRCISRCWGSLQLQGVFH